MVRVCPGWLAVAAQMWLVGAVSLRTVPSEEQLRTEAVQAARLQLQFEQEFERVREENAAALEQVKRMRDQLPATAASFLEEDAETALDPAKVAAAQAALQAFCDGASESSAALAGTGEVLEKLRAAEAKLRTLCPQNTGAY